MSGLAATETRLDGGAVNVRIGEGRTAEVLRNLCLEVHDQDPSPWDRLVVHIRSLFGAELAPPRYVAARGEIVMTYRERGVRLDLSSAGRGLQQTLLLLAYMYANPGAVLLLGVPNLMAKKSFYELADYVPDSEIDPEISEKLDTIARVAESVTPGDLAPQGRRLASLGQIAC